ncbi:MAG TPA: Hsp20/alpha crystallin family protein [Opitutaceae bacterium]|nr:Hsp20/alpha crystallin family protein [Opitutaceae bacterium]HRJ48476.1 Hsp20/alpha crystallin family protein [Opitutaceae bacterium]
MTLVRYTYPTYRSPLAFRASPWAGLETEIDRLFSSAFANLGTPATDARFPVDLYEDKDHTFVRAELPGVNREDIHVEIVDGYLTINATRKFKDGDQEQSFALNRSVQLPDAVQADRITAAYENGVLTVTLPKQEEAKPRKITVTVN